MLPVLPRRALVFRRASRLGVVLAAALGALPAVAQTVAFGGIKADTSAPVEVTADSLRVDQSTGQATFAGNVLIGQGEMRLSAETVTVTYAAGGQQKIQSLNAKGKVTLVNGPDAAEAADAYADALAQEGEQAERSVRETAAKALAAKGVDAIITNLPDRVARAVHGPR